MDVRTLSKELQKIAINELYETPETIQDDLENLREWLQKQLHLNVIQDDQVLITFLRGCKWSLQRTKEKLDHFCTTRSLWPEAFTNRDPFDLLMQRMVETGILYPLPNDESLIGPRLLYADLSVVDYETMDVNALFKLFFAVTDMLMFNDDRFLIAGEKLIVNFAEIPFNFYLQLTPTIVKKFIICWVNAYPLRIKLLIGLNTPPAIEKIYSTIKPLLSKKHQKRVFFFTPKNNEKAFKHIPKNLFPEEIGGNNGSRLELAEACKRQLVNQRNYLLDDYIYTSNEKLRLGRAKTHNEVFGMEGTFKKLSID